MIVSEGWRVPGRVARAAQLLGRGPTRPGRTAHGAAGTRAVATCGGRRRPAHGAGLAAAARTAQRVGQPARARSACPPAAGERRADLQARAQDAATFDPDPRPAPDSSGQIADVVGLQERGLPGVVGRSRTCKRGGFFSRRHLRPRRTRAAAFVPALRHLPRRGRAHDHARHPAASRATSSRSTTSRAPRHRRRRLRPLRRQRPGHPEDPRAGRRRPVARPRRTTVRSGPRPQAASPNSAHSIFIWQDGDKAYAVIVDNTELSDVDIFDITDPRDPVFIADLDLVELAFDQGDRHHRQRRAQRRLDLPSTTWSSSRSTACRRCWLLLGRRLHQARRRRSREPADHRRLRRSHGTRDAARPATAGSRRGQRPPGASSATTTSTCSAADEDFDQFRAARPDRPRARPRRLRVRRRSRPRRRRPARSRTDTGIDGRHALRRHAAARRPTSRPTRPATTNDRASIERGGTCDFQVKAENAEARGYDGVISSTTTPARRRCEALLDMRSRATPATRSIFVPRDGRLRMLGAYDPPTYKCTDATRDTTPAPAAPTTATRSRIAPVRRLGLHAPVPQRGATT